MTAGAALKQHLPLPTVLYLLPAPLKSQGEQRSGIPCVLAGVLQAAGFYFS